MLKKFLSATIVLLLLGSAVPSVVEAKAPGQTSGAAVRRARAQATAAAARARAARRRAAARRHTKKKHVTRHARRVVRRQQQSGR